MTEIPDQTLPSAGRMRNFRGIIGSSAESALPGGGSGGYN